MRFKRLAVAGLLAATTVSLGHAQVKATSVPISRDTVTLRLVADQTPAKLTVQNGAMARLSVKDGPTLGLIPVTASEGVDLGVVEITADPVSGNEGVRQVAKVALSLGQVVQLDAIPIPLEVELLQVDIASSQTPGTNRPHTTCCVTCGELTRCGCWVTTDCGGCCCSNACDCPWSPNEATCTAVSAKPASAVGGR